MSVFVFDGILDGVQYSRQVFRALDTHGSGGITFTVIDDDPLSYFCHKLALVILHQSFSTDPLLLSYTNREMEPKTSQFLIWLHSVLYRRSQVYWPIDWAWMSENIADLIAVFRIWINNYCNTPTTNHCSCCNYSNWITCLYERVVSYKWHGQKGYTS